jgi:hypothetical protein
MNALLLALCLAQAADAEALEKFKADIKGKDGAGRAAAIEELAKTKSPKICNRLASLLLNEVIEVRAAAARGLGTQEDKKRAVNLLVAAIPPAAKEPVVLAAILSALGKLGEETGVGEVNKHVSHAQLEVARAAVESAGEIRSTTSFDPLIKAMKDCEDILKPREERGPGGGFGGGGFGRGGLGGDGSMQSYRDLRERAQTLKPEIQKVLVAMAKVNCQDAQDWALWWKENRSKFKPEKP